MMIMASVNNAHCIIIHNTIMNHIVVLDYVFVVVGCWWWEGGGGGVGGLRLYCKTICASFFVLSFLMYILLYYHNSRLLDMCL